MRAKQFTEAALGISPKREKRQGSRPDRGHEPQQRYVTDRKTGKQYDPDQEFDKLKNSPEFQAQMKRMATNEAIPKGNEQDVRRKLIKYIARWKGWGISELELAKTNELVDMYKQCQAERKDWENRRNEWWDKGREVAKEKGINFTDALKLVPHDLDRDHDQGRLFEGSLEEYGDTAKGQKMLTKVQKRAVDRVTSKKADTDPKYAKKNQDTANAAWERMSDKDVSESDPGISKKKETEFHSKLDNLVHDTFGKRDAEMQEAPIVHKNDVVQTDLQPGDEVACDAGMGKTMFGIVKRIGRTMIHVQMRSGEVAAFAPKHVELMTPTYWQDKMDAETARRAKWKKKVIEGKTVKTEPSKPRNFVAKNMGVATSGAGAHKDKKKAEKQGDVKHKAKAIPLDEVMAELERQFKEEKAPRALCISSKPDEDLGASQLASCKSQGLRARDGNKSHKLGKSPKSRVKVGGHKIKGNKYGGPLPDWS